MHFYELGLKKAAFAIDAKSITVVLEKADARVELKSYTMQ